MTKLAVIFIFCWGFALGVVVGFAVFLLPYYGKIM